MDDKFLENFFKVVIPIMIFVVFAAIYLGSPRENLTNQERIYKNAERKCKKILEGGSEDYENEYMNCLADNGFKINN